MAALGHGRGVYDGGRTVNARSRSDPPQHPPPAAAAEVGCSPAPCVAKTENCLRTFAAPQSGQSGVLARPHELLEVRLARHADVLVDRHRGRTVSPTEPGMEPSVPTLSSSHVHQLRRAGRRPIGRVLRSPLRWPRNDWIDHGNHVESSRRTGAPGVVRAERLRVRGRRRACRARGRVCPVPRLPGDDSLRPWRGSPSGARPRALADRVG